jgi:hypothetical protein
MYRSITDVKTLPYRFENRKFESSGPRSCLRPYISFLDLGIAQGARGQTTLNYLG